MAVVTGIEVIYGRFKVKYSKAVHAEILHTNASLTYSLISIPRSSVPHFHSFNFQFK
jgi:hypothetical protein